MIRRLKLLISSLAIVLASLCALAAPVTAQASPPEQLACEGSGGTWNGTGCSQGTRTVVGTIKSVANILIFITSAISVLMVIIGGVRYAISGGEQKAIAAAKNTILYAIIGLILAAAAYAIVNFVLGNL